MDYINDRKQDLTFLRKVLAFCHRLHLHSGGSVFSALDIQDRCRNRLTHGATSWCVGVNMTCRCGVGSTHRYVLIQLGELTTLASSANETISGRNPPFLSAYAGLLENGKRSRPQYPLDHRHGIGMIVQRCERYDTICERTVSLQSAKNSPKRHEVIRLLKRNRRSLQDFTCSPSSGRPRKW